MVGDVEVLVVDPHRVGQAAGDLADPLPVAGHEGDPRRDERDQPVVVEAVVRWLEHHDRADVHRRRRLLQVEEGRVEGRQAVGHPSIVSDERTGACLPRLARMLRQPDRSTSARLALAAMGLSALVACSSQSPSATGGGQGDATSPASGAPAGSDATSATSAASASASGPATSTARALAITVTGKQVTPAPTTVDLPVGQTLTLTVTSDHDDQLHAHGFEIEKDVKAGTPIAIVLKGAKPGRVRGRDAPPAADAAVRRRPLTGGRSASSPPCMPALPTLLLPAHGVGSRQDLPLPFAAVVLGAAAALVVSFVALGALWREPRLGRDERHPAAPLGCGRARLPRRPRHRAWC